MRLTYAQRSGAGGYADERFERGRASFRKATLRPMLLLAVPFVGVAAILYVADFGHRWSWFGGALFGIGLSLVVYARDAVPEYIEHWRTGADAERRTAAKLGGLRRRGWTLVHDVDTGHGNYDHVVAGPAGVFLLETKELGGRVRVEGDIIHVDRRHDPDARYPPQPLGVNARRAAAELKEQLQRRSGERVWVQSVVVFWGDFEQRELEGDRVVFLHGDRLAPWLRERPKRLAPDRVDRVAAALEEIKREGTGAHDSRQAKSELPSR